ncbi:hypothetical protein CsSME_00019674 [Camellia sinensis var. sinensis]
MHVAIKRLLKTKSSSLGSSYLILQEEGWRIEIGRITRARGFIGSRNKRWPDKGCKRRGQWCSIFMEYEGAVVG